MEYLKNRRTVRQFDKNYKIPEEILQKILDIALISPSGRDLQGLDLVVLTNREKIDEATKITFDSWPEEKKNNWLKRKDNYGVDNVVSCDASVIVFMISTSRAEKQFLEIDSGIMSMSIMVSSKEFGLDTMCLGALLWGDKIGLEKYLEIPEGNLIMAIAIGKAKENLKLTEKTIKANIRFIN